MSERNCTTCRFGYEAEEYYSNVRMKWCCMLETGGERQRYALGKARYEPRSCIRWEGEEARLVATNHDYFFGTPERTAESLFELAQCRDEGYPGCAAFADAVIERECNPRLLREWLESEAGNE